MASGGAERRRYLRVPYGQRGWFEAGSVTLYAAVGNLSEGGLYVRTHAPLPRGTVTRVRLPVGAEGELLASAEVKWASAGGPGPVGMGLEFVELPETDRVRIRALLGADRLR